MISFFNDKGIHIKVDEQTITSTLDDKYFAKRMLYVHNTTGLDDADVKYIKSTAINLREEKYELVCGEHLQGTKVNEYYLIFSRDFGHNALYVDRESKIAYLCDNKDIFKTSDFTYNDGEFSGDFHMHGIVRSNGKVIKLTEVDGKERIVYGDITSNTVNKENK